MQYVARNNPVQLAYYLIKNFELLLLNFKFGNSLFAMYLKETN